MNKRLRILLIGFLLILTAALTCAIFVNAYDQDEIAKSPEDKLIPHETDVRLFLTDDAEGCDTPEALQTLLASCGAEKISILNEDMVTAVCEKTVLNVLSEYGIFPVEEEPLNADAPFLFRLEDYPQFDNINELDAYVRDVMGINETEILNDTYLTGRYDPDSDDTNVLEGRTAMHALGRYLGQIPRFSRHVGSDPVYDYYHIYDVYECNMHQDCTIVSDTGERVGFLCPGASCQYN